MKRSYNEIKQQYINETEENNKILKTISWSKLYYSDNIIEDLKKNNLDKNLKYSNTVFTWNLATQEL